MMTEILIFPRNGVSSLPDAAAWPFHEADWPVDWSWGERSRVEEDESWLQLIPYLLLANNEGQLWAYRRCGGDRRLDGSFSCGVGGHVDRGDQRSTLGQTAQAALLREADEELGVDLSAVTMAPAAWLYEGRTPVGRVHLGLVYVSRWLHARPPDPVQGETLEGQGFMPPVAISKDRRFELWSRLAAGFASRNPI